MDISRFDTRRYRTVSVQDGYGEWAATYEDDVLDLMDLRLLDRLDCIPWRQLGSAADLGCGTGRTGVWLAERQIERIDGVDLTPEMLERARAKGVFARLEQADLAATPLPSGDYDVVTTVLVDEHLPDLRPLYREAARLARPGGYLVLVGYHPYFMLNGIPTHFDGPDGEPVSIQCYVHLFSDHIRAAREADLVLLDLQEGVVDGDWLARKPRWGRFERQPVSFAFAWRKPAGR